MFNAHNELMQANREGREYGATEERRRVQFRRDDRAREAR
jgi:hypothetical protein